MHESTKAKLEDKLNRLLKRVNEIDADLSEEPDDDWQERATELEEEEAQSEVGNVALKEINQIRYALKLIEQGTYGVCGKCGKQISKGRLEVVPAATTCTACT